MPIDVLVGIRNSIGTSPSSLLGGLPHGSILMPPREAAVGIIQDLIDL